MWNEFTLRPVSLRYEKPQLKAFLAEHGLKYEENIETAFGLFDEEEAMLGCGCAAGSLLKCFAVAEALRGQNALGTLVSALVQERFSAGFTQLFTVTRAHNERLFQGCGFYTVAKTDTLILLENRKDGPERFCRPFLQPGDAEKSVGAIVMHCNPFTLGHRYLIEEAAKRTEVLHIFVLEEDGALFPAADRLRLVREGTADLVNVRVHSGGPYMISSATFPTYFLKQNEDAARLQCALDAAVFAKRIAPALHITRRFVGSEPIDALTAAYNGILQTALPEKGIQVTVIERKTQDGEVISASRVRALLQTPGGIEQALTLVPPCTAAYIRDRFGK